MVLSDKVLDGIFISLGIHQIYRYKAYIIRLMLFKIGLELRQFFCTADTTMSKNVKSFSALYSESIFRPLQSSSSETRRELPVFLRRLLLQASRRRQLSKGLHIQLGGFMHMIFLSRVSDSLPFLIEMYQPFQLSIRGAVLPPPVKNTETPRSLQIVA